MAKEEFYKYMIRGHKNPEDLLERLIINLESKSIKQLSILSEHHSYLANQRELIIDDILDVINANSTSQIYYSKLSRIVGSTYQSNPLSTVGSIKVNNRFNFSEQISSNTKPFQAIYLGENFQTAYLEKFHHTVDEKFTNHEFGPEAFLLSKPDDFSNFTIEVKIDSAVDLRNDHFFNELNSIISKIKPNLRLLAEAKKAKIKELEIIQTSEALKATVFDKKFAQYPLYLSQPANSQWLGHYIRLAGIQSVIYPSVRNLGGFNLVVFPDNLAGTDAHLRLTGDWPQLAEDLKIMNTKTFHFFMTEKLGNNKILN